MEPFSPYNHSPQPVKPCMLGGFEESDFITFERCKCEKQKDRPTSRNDPSSSNLNRKHILSFQPESEPRDNGDDACMDQERLKCKAFWSFIDSAPDLQNLVHNGKFVYSSKPTDLNKKQGVKKPMHEHLHDPDIIPVPPMPLENKSRIESIRKSFQERQNGNKANEEKYGLRRITETKSVIPDTKSFCEKYWEKRTEAFQLSLDMDKYDKTKWCSESSDLVYKYLEFEDYGEE